jgi:hypothetical protein
MFNPLAFRFPCAIRQFNSSKFFVADNPKESSRHHDCWVCIFPSLHISETSILLSGRSVSVTALWNMFLLFSILSKLLQLSGFHRKRQVEVKHHDQMIGHQSTAFDSESIHVSYTLNIYSKNGSRYIWPRSRPNSQVTSMMRKANNSIFDYELVTVARLWLKRIRFSESFVVALALRPAGVGTISMIQNNRYCDKSCGTIETIAKFC